MIGTSRSPIVILLAVLATVHCDARRSDVGSDQAQENLAGASSDSDHDRPAKDGPPAEGGAAAHQTTPPDAGAPPDLRALGDRAHALRRNRDGPGCLRVLDQIAAATGDSTDLARNADKNMSWTRAVCEILAGSCDEGHEQLVRYYVEQAGKTERQARSEADQLVLRSCPTHIGHWKDRFHRLDFQSGEAWQRKDGDWCQVQLTDLENALAEAGRAIDQESRGRARRARRLLRQCVTQAGKSPNRSPDAGTPE